MPAYYSDNPVPRAAIVGIGALLLVTFLWVGVTRLGGETPGEALAEPVIERSLRFEDLADGGVAVRDAASGQMIERLEPGSNHFVRAIMRGLVRERLRRGEGEETPFQLAQRIDGRLTLVDPTTRRIVDLGAFGSSNSGVFAAFLAQQSTATQSSATPAIQNAAVQTVQGSKQ